MSVYISYWPPDTRQASNRAATRLIQRFGRKAVVIVQDTAQVGRPYRTVITEHLENADVVLALSGPRSIAERPDGRRRLDWPHDTLRLELKLVLERQVPVIPVLVDGVRVPHPDYLPDDLQGLASGGTVEVAHHRFDLDYELMGNAWSSS